MNRVYLCFFFLIGFALVSNAQADMSFKEVSHDFGKVHAGKDTLWYNFTFTNTGNEPLQISDVKTSCDCTLAEWPKGPVQPGKSAVVRGGFKLENKSGSFVKSVIITSNTAPAITILTIKGDIVDTGSSPQ